MGPGYVQVCPLPLTTWGFVLPKESETKNMTIKCSWSFDFQNWGPEPTSFIYKAAHLGCFIITTPRKSMWLSNLLSISREEAADFMARSCDCQEQN